MFQIGVLRDIAHCTRGQLTTYGYCGSGSYTRDISPPTPHQKVNNTPGKKDMPLQQTSAKNKCRTQDLCMGTCKDIEFKIFHSLQWFRPFEILRI